MFNISETQFDGPVK